MKSKVRIVLMIIFFIFDVVMNFIDIFMKKVIEYWIYVNGMV